MNFMLTTEAMIAVVQEEKGGMGGGMGGMGMQASKLAPRILN